MALRDHLPPWMIRGAAPLVVPSAPTTTEIVDASAPPPLPKPQAVEYGTSGTENWGGFIRREDYNPQFDDFQKAVQIYEEMRRTDAQIRSMLQVMKLPLRGAQWVALPAPGGDPVDQLIADFVNECIFDDDAMDHPWDFVLRHILTQLDYGFSVSEIVYHVDEDGFYRVKKIAPRLARTIREWHVDRDGRLEAVVQYAAVPTKGVRPFRIGGVPIFNTFSKFEHLTMPAEYLLVTTNDREGDNFAGVSLLRTVYRNWWYKNEAYKQEGVALDRYAVGIPVAELEENHTLQKTDLTMIATLLKGIRSNERSYAITPPHVKLKILPEGGMGGARATSSNWIDHHDTQIARNILAGFLTMGAAPLGTLGFGSRLTDMFISSLAGVGKGITGELKQQVVKPLVDLNFNMTGRQYPSIVVQDIENVDISQIIEVFGKLTGTVLTPTDDDEKMLRKIMGMPDLAPDSSRKAAQEKAAVAADAATAVGERAPGQPGEPTLPAPLTSGQAPATPPGPPVSP